MAEFTSFISSGSQGGGGGGSRTQTTSDVLGGVAQLAGAGLDIFKAVQAKDVAQQAAAQQAAQNNIVQMANSFVSNATDALQGGSALTAQNNIAKEYSKNLALLDADSAATFRETVQKGLGFNPVAEVRSAAVTAENDRIEAQQAVVNGGRDYALGTLGMSQAAFEALPVEQQQAYGFEAQALSDSIAREKAQLDLMAARGAANDRVKSSAVGTASRVAGDLADQRVGAALSEWQAATDSGDPQLIAQTQVKLQSQLAQFRSGTSSEISQGLSTLGYTDVSASDIQAQTTAVNAKYQAVEGVFQSSNFVTASRDAQTAAVLMANGAALVGAGSERKKVAANVAIDMALGGQGTIIKALDVNEQLTGLVVSRANQNGQPVANPTQASAQLIQSSFLKGPAAATAESQASSQEVGKEISTVWTDAIKTMSTSNDPEIKQMGGDSIIGLINSGISGRGEERKIAMDSFVPMLNTLSNPKVGKAYASEMLGTEQAMGAYMSEFIRSSLVPSTARSISVQDLGDYTLEVSDAGIKVIPPLRSIGAFSPASPTGGAQQGLDRVAASRGFTKPVQILEKMSLMASNLYNIPPQITRQSLAEQWAKSLGMNIKLEEKEEVVSGD